MRILVIDDEPELCSEGLEQIFAGVAELKYTRTPSGALRLIQSESFDAILLDGYLDRSGTSGPDCLLNWKAAGIILPPVIMISGAAEMNRAGLLAGAVGVLNKCRLNHDWPAVKETLGIP